MLVQSVHRRVGSPTPPARVKPLSCVGGPPLPQGHPICGRSSPMSVRRARPKQPSSIHAQAARLRSRGHRPTDRASAHRHATRPFRTPLSDTATKANRTLSASASRLPRSVPGGSGASARAPTPAANPAVPHARRRRPRLPTVAVGPPSRRCRRLGEPPPGQLPHPLERQRARAADQPAQVHAQLLEFVVLHATPTATPLPSPTSLTARSTKLADGHPESPPSGSHAARSRPRTHHLAVPDLPNRGPRKSEATDGSWIRAKLGLPDQAGPQPPSTFPGAPREPRLGTRHF